MVPVEDPVDYSTESSDLSTGIHDEEESDLSQKCT
jgi:hypothetical protein